EARVDGVDVLEVRADDFHGGQLSGGDLARQPSGRRPDYISHLGFPGERLVAREANSTRQMESPGLMSRTFTLFPTSSCSWLGLPERIGKVPKCMGTTVLTPSSWAALAARSGPIV